MGKKLARSKKDSIEEIEIILDRETQKIETRKSKKAKKPAKAPKTPKKHQPTKHPIIVSFIATLIIVAVPVFMFFHYFGALSDFIKGATKPEETSEEQPEEPETEKINFGTTPIVVYISGSDSRVNVQDAKARSDVNILAVINPTTSKILLVSIPRDYYVRLHGTTGLRDKLTHAGIYGIDMSRQTIEDLLGVKVDKTVKVGFDALETIVDALGGIDIYSDQDLTTLHNKCHFVVGTQHVNGACALGFSRERYAYATGDRHRGQNQQQVISKILEKATTPAYLLKLPEILRAADGLFETSFTYNEILDMIKYQIFSNPKWSTESISLDGTGSMQPTYSMPGQNLYVMLPNDATIIAAKDKIIHYLKTAEQLKAEEEEKARLEAEQAENNNTELTE